MKVELHDFAFNDLEIEKIYKCPDCRLFWYHVDDLQSEVEFRLAAFIPLEPKKCPWCADPNKEIPLELKEFRKKV